MTQHEGGRLWERKKVSHNAINFVILNRTAGCGRACPVVWEGGGQTVPLSRLAGMGAQNSCAILTNR